MDKVDVELAIAEAIDTNDMRVYQRGSEALKFVKEFGVKFTLPGMEPMFQKLHRISQATQLMEESNPLKPYINNFYIIWPDVRQVV